MSLGSLAADGDSSGQQEPPDPDAIEIDPTLRYVRYKDVLGKGAFKTVFKAFDELDGIEVAWNQIKVEDFMQYAEDPSRMYSEINLLKSVKHENIVKFYASWIDDEKKTINIITELFTSGNLRQYRRKHKKVDMKAIKGWARQILIGLDYLHSQKPPIIHRDLKCDNIFINGNNGEVKIGDLGLATIMHNANAKTVIGTPEFMAPELYDEEYNELVDIYSFGMCILEMVTFEYPYSECTNSAQIFKKVSTGVKPVALSKVKDLEVKTFIEKCLVPASQRLSARELLHDPFLCIDGSTEVQHILYCPSDTISFERDDCDVSHVTLGESSHNSVKMLSYSSDNTETMTWTSTTELSEPGSHCMQLDPKHVTLTNLSPNNSFDLRGPIVVSHKTEHSNQHLTGLEVEEVWRENKFRLRGSRSGAGSISLMLWIEGPKDRLKSEFPFFLDSDTSSSVATEIVEYFNLANEDIYFIAYLIDSLFVKLIPGWQSYVPIIHTVSACEVTHVSAQSIKAGVGSFRHSSEVTNSHYDTPFVNKARPGVLQASEASLSSVADVLTYDSPQNIGRSSNVLGAFANCPSNKIDCIGYEMGKDEIFMHPNNQRDQHMGIQTICDASILSGIISNQSSTFADKVEDNAEVDEELMIELDMLELQFQRAINYIVHEKQQAIKAAKKRAANRRWHCQVDRP